MYLMMIRLAVAYLGATSIYLTIGCGLPACVGEFLAAWSAIRLLHRIFCFT